MDCPLPECSALFNGTVWLGVIVSVISQTCIYKPTLMIRYNLIFKIIYTYSIVFEDPLAFIQYRLKIRSQLIVCSVRVVRACTFLLVRIRMYTQLLHLQQC